MKLHIFLFCLIITSASCKSDFSEVEQAFLTIDLTEAMLVNLPMEATEKTIDVKTNLTNWQIKSESECNWCEASVLKSIDSNAILLKTKSNENRDKRKMNFIVSGLGITDQKIQVTQLGIAPIITANIESKSLTFKESTFDFEIVSNIPYTVSNKESWLKNETPSTRSLITEKFTFTTTTNTDFKIRRDTIFIEEISDQANKIKLSIPVEQACEDIVEAFPDDKKIQIIKVDLVRGNTYGNENKDMTIDGKYNTHYSSSKTPLGDSIILEYTIAPQTERIDYIKLIQRADNNAGSIFSKGSVWYQTSDDTSWKLYQTFNVDPGTHAELNRTIDSPTKIKVCIQSNIGHAVALGEFEAFESGDKGDLTNDAKYFEDDVFSILKESTTVADLEQITNPLVRSIAENLLANTYPKEFRARKYAACKNPVKVGNDLKIGGRSQFDNPTGIFLKSGEKYIIFTGKQNTTPIKLVIKDFRKDGGSESYTLKEGVNIIRPSVAGNVYIQYWSDQYEALDPIAIHITFADEIGFWDKRAGHTNEDWVRILNLARNTASKSGINNAMIDVLGYRIQLVNTVNAFDTYCKKNIENISLLHDSIQNIEYRMMGLYKNNAVPYNRTLNARSWGGLPNWNGIGAWYPNIEDEMLVEERLRQSIWVFGHELGHGNQIKPHMQMTGWGETSNNNYNQYVQYLLGNKQDLRIDHERINRKQGDPESLIGGRFNAFLNEAHVVKEPYLTQEGPDYKKGSMNGTGLRGDHFVKCAPLWQLTLYFIIAGEGTDWYRPDFWADVNWGAITDNRTNLSNGARYVNFMKRCIEASNLNLVPFFTQMGLLRVVDRSIDDYAVGQVTINQNDIDEVTLLGSSKNMPSSPVISYISMNSVDAFKNKKAVVGVFNQGVSGSGITRIVNHSVWKNVVVFETYNGANLIDLCMVGTGSNNNSSTQVRYPTGATRIEAVAWDGERTLVYGNR